MSHRVPQSFRGPRAWTVLGLLAAGTVAAAWASHSAQSTLPLPPTGFDPPQRFASAASGPVTVETRFDRTAVLQGGDGLVRMELVLRGEEREGTALGAMPTDLVVLLDRSGSMNGQKIARAREAVRDLVERLGPNDRFGLVSFNGSASLDVALAPATDENRRTWTSRIAGIGSGGGTCIRCALETGVGVVESTRRPERASRLLLISDGLSDATGLTELASRAARGESVVSAIGVGLDFNESLMTSVADAGTGNFYFLADAGALARVFEGEFLAARATVASALEVTLQPPPGAELVDAAGYPIERNGSGLTFRPGSLFSGQERRIWVTWRLPTGAPLELPLGPVRVAYRDGDTLGSVVVDDLPRVACVRDESRYRQSFDGPAMLDALRGEALGALQQSVASSVAGGRRDEAARSIDDYLRSVQELAAAEPALAPAAAEILADAEELKKEADGVFEGANAPMKQKAFAKDNAAKGWESRRQGAKALPTEVK
jgi:Ca-activated chloride channel family protein